MRPAILAIVFCVLATAQASFAAAGPWFDRSKKETPTSPADVMAVATCVARQDKGEWWGFIKPVRSRKAAGLVERCARATLEGRRFELMPNLLGTSIFTAMYLLRNRSPLQNEGSFYLPAKTNGGWYEAQLTLMDCIARTDPTLAEKFVRLPLGGDEERLIASNLAEEGVHCTYAGDLKYGVMGLKFGIGDVLLRRSLSLGELAGGDV